MVTATASGFAEVMSPATPAPAAWAVAALGVSLGGALLQALFLLSASSAFAVGSGVWPQLVLLTVAALLLQIGGLLELVQANQ